MPTLAAINGPAAAGRFELLLCSDMVLAADTAQIGDGHMAFGGLPGAGGSVRLLRRLPRNIAAQVLLKGALFPAVQWATWGQINRVVPAADLEDTALTWATDLARRSRAGVAVARRLLAGDAGADKKAIAQEAALFEDVSGRAGGLWMDSSSWLITARNPA